jgi:hypothetical protein
MIAHAADLAQRSRTLTARHGLRWHVAQSGAGRTLFAAVLPRDAAGRARAQRALMLLQCISRTAAC